MFRSLVRAFHRFNAWRFWRRVERSTRGPEFTRLCIRCAPPTWHYWMPACKGPCQRCGCYGALMAFRK